MSEKSKHQKIREILETRRAKEIYPTMSIIQIWRTGEEKPKIAKYSKREFTGDNRIFQVDLDVNGDIDEELIRYLKKQFNKRRLRLNRWTVIEKAVSKISYLRIEFYSVY